MGKASLQHAKQEKHERCRTALAMEPVQQQSEHMPSNTGTNQHETVKCISQSDDVAQASEIEAPSTRDEILSSEDLASNHMPPSGARPRAGSTGHQKTQAVKTVAVAEAASVPPQAASATAAHYTASATAAHCTDRGDNDAGSSKSHVCGLAIVPVLSESDHDSAVTTDEGEASEEESGQAASDQYSSDTESCEDPQDSEHATSTKVGIEASYQYSMDNATSTKVGIEASYQYSIDNESCEYPQDSDHRSTCQVLGGSAPSAPVTSGGSKVLCRPGSMQMSPITSCQLCLV